MKEVGIPVELQNCDEWWEGARTGWTSAEAAKELGIWGSLINHSEHKTKPGSIKKMLKHWPEGFKSIVCIHSWGQAERWAKNIKPDLVAYEPTYLIGSKDKSVSTEKPDMIKKLAEHYQPIPLLAGAGVHNTEDVRVAKTLGAKGILVASDVVKADNPEKELAELAGGFSV
jgi:triosephosphate isomerase